MEKTMLQVILSVVLTTFLMMSFGAADAQLLDSLKAQLELARGTAQCSTQCRIAYELVDVDDSTALAYAKQSLRCATLHRDTLLMIRSTRIKALAFGRLGERDSSIATNMSMLSVARRMQYDPELHYMLHGLAAGYMYKGQFDEALRYNYEALDIRKKIASPAIIASTFNNIGIVYYKLHDYPNALENFADALKQYEIEPRDGKSEATTLVNIALCYAYSGKLDKSDSTIAAALHRCKGDCLENDVIDIAFCRGIIALGRSDTTAAKQHFIESYKMSRAKKEERFELDNIIYLSRIYLASNNITEAERYLDVARQLIAEGVPYHLELMKVYGEFVNLYEKKGDYRKAFEYQRRFMVMKDSLHNEENTVALMRIEANHIEKEKNARIELQNQMLELNARIISRQRIATIFACTTTALLIGFVILLVRSIRDKKNRNADLELRVKGRTAELESMVNHSNKALKEKKMWLEKIHSTARHTNNSINGLSTLATKDPESSGKCIRLIEHEMTQLLAHIGSYVTRSDSGVNDFRNMA